MIRALTIAAALMLAPAAIAHRQHAVLTSVESHPRTGKTEIVHRLHGEDLEIALSARGASVAALEALARSAFTIVDAKGKPIPLTFIGAEAEGLDVYLYFEGPALKPGFRLRSGFFLDDFDGQINTVNVRVSPAPPRTLVFRAGDGLK